jgi:polyketide synthase PksJ
MDITGRISKLSPELRKLLALKLKQQGIGILQIPITKENRAHRQGLPLSFGQQRLWFIQQLEPHNTAYNLIRASKLEGNLDKQALEKSINEIIRRHEILRTIFIFDKEKPTQVILPQLSLPLEIENLKNLPEEQHETKIKQVIRDESRYWFDLAKGPLLRTKLLVLGQDQHVFLLVTHHIISDGTSIQVFIRELVRLYQAYSQGKEPQLSGLPVQYADYACWQQQWFGDGAAEIGFKKKQEAYWLDRFKGEIPVLTLPFDFPRPVIRDFNGNTAAFSVDIDEASTLKEMALKERTTLYVVLLSLYNIFLSKLSRMEDIIVGTPVAGRRHPDIQDLIGMFVNTLVPRNFPHHDKTFTDFLAEVKENTLNAFESQEYRYEDIVEKVNVSRDTSRNPLFDVMFLFKNVDYAEVNIPGLTLKHYEYDSNTAKFDLTLSAWEDAGTLHFSFEYCTKLFRPTTIQRFAGYFKQLVRGVVHDCQIKLAEIDILPDDEKKKILVDFNDTAAEYPKDKTIQQLFEAQVDHTPDHIAVIGARQLQEEGTSGLAPLSNHITYNELNQGSDQLARLLVEKGVKPGTIVGIMVGRSIRMIIGILGILKAGAAYLPLDPIHPEKRMNYMLVESGTSLLLTTTYLSGKLENLSIANCQLLMVNEKNTAHLHLPPEPPTAVSFSTLTSTLTCQVSSANLAYVIYTSGTTGIPKGVVIEHRSVVNFIKGMTDIIDFKRDDTILSLTTFSFDIFSLETIVPLTQGSTVVMGSSAAQTDPAAAAVVILKEKVTIFQVTPSRLQLFLSREEASTSLRLLRYLLVGGEAFPVRLLEQTRPLVGGKIYNLYGPTETTIWSTAKDLSGQIPLNIGKPIVNTAIYILDKFLTLVPIGVVGEIYIGGDGAARGYLNNPELTAEKFILATKTQRHKDVYFSWCPGALVAKLYKTGDLGRWLSDGDIECLGRVDLQVKIRGYRIEPEEIEGRLMSHEAVKEAVVIARKNETNDKFLCAYYVPVNNHGDLHVPGLREFLSVELPDYMIPSYFVPLKRIPLTPNKKIDRKALPDHDGTRPPVGTAYLAPQTDLERKIAGCWMNVLKVDRVGIHDKFFDLGGNSLNIIRLNNQLKEALGKDIPVVSMFQHLTIASFARFIMEKESQVLLTGEKSRHQKEEALPLAKKRFQDTLKRTRQRENAGKNGKNGLEIAVIGMAGRFPGARNIDEFWENLKNGVNSITFFTEEEIEKAGIEPHIYKDPNYVKARGIVENMEYFDALFFGYSPMEAEILDPQVRIFQEICWEALEDGGYDPSTYKGLIGVYAGAASNRWWEILAIMSGKNDTVGRFSADYLIDKDLLATRMSYKMDLKGPAITMHSTCSTALAAVDTACRALLTGQCDAALAGGVSILPQMKKSGYLYETGMIRSPDGYCRAFDAKAKGTIFSDGAGVVLLKPLDKAIADRDNIYAVIKGSAANNDGSEKSSFSAPGIKGQAGVIRTALYMAGAEPGSITYVETHGTGTEMGDPIEIEALKMAFNTNKKKYCAVGSVKTNIGHLDTAAGIAGFIKTVLALNYRRIPPGLNFETPNPEIDFENSPFYVNTQLREWKNKDYPLRAGVSSFGIGGTNVHVVLEQAPVIGHSSLVIGEKRKEKKYQLIVLSAKTSTALDKMTKNLAEYFKHNLLNHGNHENPVNPGLTLADAAYTLKVGRKAFEHRKMLVCRDIKEGVEILESADSSSPNQSSVHSRKIQTYVTKEEKRVVFMFPGQGSQYVDMGRGLYETEPVFRREMDRCFEILEPLIGCDIKEILYPGVSVSKVSGDIKYRSAQCPLTNQSPLERGTPDPRKGGGVFNINRTAIAQPVIFTIEYALAKLLMSWGITPYAMIGHSIGEYTAACLAGVFSLEDGLTIVAWRGKLMQRMPGGSMLSVPLPEQELKPLLTGELALAAVNGPGQCVVSGPRHAVNAFARQLKEKDCLYRELHTSHAFHSRMMAPILNTFEEKVCQITLNEPEIPFISNVTGKWLTFADALDPKYWTRHLHQTVRFGDGTAELLKEKNAIFIEVGPGHTLSTFVRQCPDKKPGHVTVNLVRHPGEEAADEYHLLSKIGQLWLYGTPMDWSGFYRGEKRHRLHLPFYPFEGQRYWLEGDPIKMIRGRTLPGHFPDKKADIADWFYIPSWKRSLPTAADPGTKKIPGPSNWLVFMSEHPLCRQLVKQLDRNGDNVITIRKGTGFAKVTAQEYNINPQNKNDYETLTRDISAAGKMPGKILHSWGITGSRPGHKGGEESTGESIDNMLDSGFYSLLYLTRAIGMQHPGEQLEMVVVTNDMQEVTGEENPCPGKSTVLGPIKVIPQEYPNIICRSVDLSFKGKRPGKVQQKRMIDQLIKEFTGNSLETVVAYRGNYRWVRTFEPQRLDGRQETAQRLRDQGVYLVTGGLGQIGLVLAQYLVKSVKAKLVLTGRSFFPPKNEWEQWLTLHDEEEPTSTKIKILRELEELGGEVMVARADIANLERMQEVITKAERQLGPINGVFHLAGIVKGPSIELIAKINKTRCQQQFQSKIYGLLVLEKLSRNKELDFCWLMSSITSVLGGLGLAAYSAGNIFMDAFVDRYNRLSSCPWISVNWHDLEPEPGQIAFQRILSFGKANRVVIYPGGNLRDRIDRWIKLESLRQADQAGRSSEIEHAHASSLQPRPNLTTPYAAPSNPLEQAVTEIWQKLFGFDRVGIHDDFFELGGDSLKSITALAGIHKELNVEVPLSEFFNRPTAAGLAGYINNAETSEFTSIEAVEKKEYHDLPFQITGMWLRYRFQVKDRHPFNVSGVYDLGPVNVNREMIEKVWQTLVERHENLRTTFLTVNGQAKMKIHSTGSIDTPFDYIDLRNRTGEDKIEEAEKITAARKNEDFDLEKGPVCRATLVQLESHHFKFVFVTHHIHSDELSKRIMEREFMILLDAFSKGEKNPLTPLEIQDKDFAAWQSRMFNGKRGKELRAFWLKKLEGKLPGSNLPMDYPRNRRKGTYRELLAQDIKESFRELTPAEHNQLIGTLNTARTVKGACYSFVIEHEIQKKLTGLALETGCSAFAVFSAALNILFYRLTRQKDSIIGAIVATREHNALENVPGNFTNTLLYRNNLQDTMTIKEYISYVAKNITEALEHREYPMEKILAQLDAALDSIGTLTMNYIKTGSNENAIITDLAPKHNRFDHVYFDIDFTLTDYSNGILVHCKYNKELFKPGTIEFISQELIALPDKMVRHSDKKIETLVFDE